MAQQGEHAIANEVGGGEVPGQQQQVAHGDDFFGGEPIAAIVHRHQRADQVIARGSAPFGDGAFKIGGQFIGIGLQRREELRRTNGREHICQRL